MEVIEEKSERQYVPTVLICLLLGELGIHRFYVGKYLTGILMLITFGGFGIWWLVDLILIILEKFKDSEGKLIKH